MEPVEVLINSGNILNKAVSLPKGTDPSTDEEVLSLMNNYFYGLGLENFN